MLFELQVLNTYFVHKIRKHALLKIIISYAITLLISYAPGNQS